jgi:hypothetical protein
MLRITLRIVCLLVGLSSAVGARTTGASSTSAPPSGGDQQIAGKLLVLKDSPAEAKKSLSTLSNDRRITLGGNGSADDPTLSAAASASTLPRATWSTAPTTWRPPGDDRCSRSKQGVSLHEQDGAVKRVMVSPAAR